MTRVAHMNLKQKQALLKLIHSAHHEHNCRLLNPPTKTQRDIMQWLSLNPIAFETV